MFSTPWAVIILVASLLLLLASLAALALKYKLWPCAIILILLGAAIMLHRFGKLPSEITAFEEAYLVIIAIWLVVAGVISLFMKVAPPKKG